MRTHPSHPLPTALITFASPESTIFLIRAGDRDVRPAPTCEHVHSTRLYFQPIRFARFDNESGNRGLPVLEAARGSLAQTRRIVDSGDENGPDHYTDICSLFFYVPYLFLVFSLHSLPTTYIMSLWLERLGEHSLCI